VRIVRRLACMIRTVLFPLTLLLLLPACGTDAPDADTELETVDLEGLPGDPLPDAPPQPDGSADMPNDGYPKLIPPVLTPGAETGVTGARSVLLDWARALELEEFDQAWAMLSDADQARWNESDFAAMFADLDEITVAVPDGTMEGAAGSTYYTAATTITASDADGRPVHYEGEVVLKRVNDVPGASAEQLRWHIERVSLDWTH